MPHERRVGLVELLRYAGEHGPVVRELTRAECEALIDPGDDLVGGVSLFDGSAIVCAMQHGFHGSEVTPADPVEVVFYAITAGGGQ